jgi:tetratricopeptide (TPR) repeat protein
MSAREARGYVKETLLRDPGTRQPMTMCQEVNGGVPIESVRLTARRLVLSAAECQKTFLLADLEPGLYLNNGGPDPTCRISGPGYLNVAGHRDRDPILRRLVNALERLRREARRPASSAEESARFDAAAAAYRAAAVKPPLPEESRRFKLQAEASVRDKAFDDAAELYGQALETAPWWPEGRFNRAVLLAESEEFGEAVAEMRRYLALAPEAANARAAQDKIYEWERKGR